MSKRELILFLKSFIGTLLLISIIITSVKYFPNEDGIIEFLAVLTLSVCSVIVHFLLRFYFVKAPKLKGGKRKK